MGHCPFPHPLVPSAAWTTSWGDVPPPKLARRLQAQAGVTPSYGAYKVCRCIKCTQTRNAATTAAMARELSREHEQKLFLDSESFIF